MQASVPIVLTLLLKVRHLRSRLDFFCRTRYIRVARQSSVTITIRKITELEQIWLLNTARELVCHVAVGGIRAASHDVGHVNE